MEEPSQFSMGQTAHSVTCSLMEKPLTGLFDCLKILLWPPTYWVSDVNKLEIKRWTEVQKNPLPLLKREQFPKYNQFNESSTGRKWGLRTRLQNQDVLRPLSSEFPRNYFSELYSSHYFPTARNTDSKMAISVANSLCDNCVEPLANAEWKRKLSAWFNQGKHRQGTSPMFWLEKRSFEIISHSWSGCPNVATIAPSS